MGVAHDMTLNSANCHNIKISLLIIDKHVGVSTYKLILQTQN